MQHTNSMKKTVIALIRLMGILILAISIFFALPKPFIGTPIVESPTPSTTPNTEPSPTQSPTVNPNQFDPRMRPKHSY